MLEILVFESEEEKRHLRKESIELFYSTGYSFKLGTLIQLQPYPTLPELIEGVKKAIVGMELLLGNFNPIFYTVKNHDKENQKFRERMGTTKEKADIESAFPVYHQPAETRGLNYKEREKFKRLYKRNNLN